MAPWDGKDRRTRDDIAQVLLQMQETIELIRQDQISKSMIISQSVDQLMKKTFGNGKPGLADEYPLTKEKVSELEKKVDGHCKNHWAIWFGFSAPMLIALILMFFRFK